MLGTMTSGTLTQEQLDHFEREGYLFFEDILDPVQDLDPIIEEYHGVLDRLIDDLFQKEEISSKYEELTFGDRLIKITQETGAIHAQYFDFHLPPAATTPDTPFWAGPAVFNALRNEKILDVVESLIGGEIYSNPIQHVRLKVPEQFSPRDPKTGAVLNGRAPWHQDNGVGTTAVDNTEMVTVWFPLDDATVEKGCLAILPRSHKQGLLVHCPTKANGIPDDSFDVASTVPMPMKRGGALFFNRRLIHGSLPNVSGEIRWSFDLRYNPIGQSTGRDSLPGFVARSRKNPETVLTDPEEWNRMWLRCREQLSVQPVPTYNRWNADDPLCA